MLLLAVTFASPYVARKRLRCPRSMGPGPSRFLHGVPQPQHRPLSPLGAERVPAGCVVCCYEGEVILNSEAVSLLLVVRLVSCGDDGWLIAVCL